MRVDPEDYAFLTSYSPARVGSATARKRAQVRGTLISMVIAVAIMTFWWSRSGHPKPGDTLTWQWFWLLVATLVVTAIAGIAMSVGGGRSGHTANVALRFVTLAALAAPVAAWWLAWHRMRTANPSATDAMPGWYQAITGVVLAISLVATLCWAGAVILGVRWVMDRRSLGWQARRLSQTTAIIALAPWIGLGVVWMAIRGKLNTNSFAWLGDATLWMWLGLIAIAAVALSINALQAADMAVLASCLEQRPALRVDPIADSDTASSSAPTCTVYGVGLLVPPEIW